MTPAERKAKHDARKREAGLVPVTVWTRPENKEIVKKVAAYPKPIDKVSVKAK